MPSSPMQHADKNLDNEEIEGFPCFCGRDESHYMLLCTVCSSWIHYECSGFQSVADLSKCLNDAPGNYVCKTCVPNLSTSKAERLKDCSQDGSLYFYSDTQAQKSEERFTEAFFQRIVIAATDAATKAVMDFVKEDAEKREKKNNLVVVGFPDVEKDEPSQNVFDKAEMGKICEKLDIPKDSIVSTFREGRTAGNRILKVCFADRRVSERRMFLARATGLIREHDNCKGKKFRPFVRPDMTASERERDYKLRQELRTRRENGELDLIIRNGNIVARPGGFAKGN